MSKTLFNEFDPISAKAWKQKIQLDLKGADYNNTLVWNSLEGIDVKPFYHADNTKDLSFQITSNQTWKSNQSIYVDNSKDANSKALDVINRGAESLTFVVPSEDVDLPTLLEGIDLINIPVFFEPEFISANFTLQLNDIAKRKKARLYLQSDIIGNLAKSGNWFNNLKNDHRNLEDIASKCDALTSIISIDISLYQNAGANIIQQLAYALAHANEYLNHFGSNLKGKVVFNLSVGSNYFFEIAKLKSLRLLWNSLASEYFEKTPDCIIIATPSKRNKTIYDYNTNLLRTTTECMSAILGGADFISNLRYDAIYHNDNEFGERIARNQLLILKHESYFDIVNNPTEGTYYIDELTDQLATKALSIFKDIEQNGGFLKQLKEGTIQRKIKESATKEQALFNNNDIVLLGTNKYQNEKDHMSNNIERYPFVKTKSRKTLIEPIIEKRLAESIEKERLENEK